MFKTLYFYTPLRERLFKSFIFFYNILCLFRFEFLVLLSLEMFFPGGRTRKTLPGRFHCKCILCSLECVFLLLFGFHFPLLDLLRCLLLMQSVFLLHLQLFCTLLLVVKVLFFLELCLLLEVLFAFLVFPFFNFSNNCVWMV